MARDEWVEIRVTAEEKAAFSAAAAQDNRTLSDWVRLTLLVALKQRAKNSAS